MKLKTFNATLYNGSIEHIDEVIKSIQVKAKSITEVNVLSLLKSHNINSNKLWRFVFLNQEMTKLSIDFGSHYQFILIEQA